MMTRKSKHKHTMRVLGVQNLCYRNPEGDEYDHSTKFTLCCIECGTVKIEVVDSKLSVDAVTVLAEIRGWDTTGLTGYNK